MKQYTTPTITVRLDGQELLLSAGSRVVLSIKSNGVVHSFEGERLSITDDAVSVRLTTEESGAMVGTNYAELTIFIDNQVHKTETMTFKITESVWGNND